jgi:RNA polymerase sigma factor (sigma-70 family)
MADSAPIPSEPIAMNDETGMRTGLQWERMTWQYSKALQRFFANRVGNPSDVNDLVQKVFVRVLQRAQGGPIEHVQQYLFQVAANVLTDEYRRAKSRHEDEHDSYDETVHQLHSEISPERIVLGQEALARVTDAVRQLPQMTRDVYVLRIRKEYEFPQIARLLRISERGAQRHMATALKILEAVLKEDRAIRDLLPRRGRPPK